MASTSKQLWRRLYQGHEILAGIEMQAWSVGARTAKEATEKIAVVSWISIEEKKEEQTLQIFSKSILICANCCLELCAGDSGKDKAEGSENATEEGAGDTTADTPKT